MSRQYTRREKCRALAGPCGRLRNDHRQSALDRAAEPLGKLDCLAALRAHESHLAFAAHLFCHRLVGQFCSYIYLNYRPLMSYLKAGGLYADGFLLIISQSLVSFSRGTVFGEHPL